MTPEPSIIIPLRNDANGLSHTLASLLAQTLPPAVWQIIVADAGSTDGTTAFLRERRRLRRVGRLATGDVAP